MLNSVKSCWIILYITSQHSSSWWNVPPFRLPDAILRHQLPSRGFHLLWDILAHLAVMIIVPEELSAPFGTLGSLGSCWLASGNSYWKWPFIVDLPVKNGDFPK